MSKIILEIHAGEGGMDAKLLVRDFLSIIQKVYKSSILSESESSVALEFKGEIEDIKWLSGSHVVQRVPPTERKGRVHTSVVGIAVYEIPDLTPTELELEFSYCHTKKKAGGQNSNKVQSTVRAKDLKTGISVRIDGRDQKYNKRKAVEVIEERVKELHDLERVRETRAKVLQDLKTNSRGCKDFTWSFKDNFVINHKNGKSCYDLTGVVKGNLEKIK